MEEEKKLTHNHSIKIANNFEVTTTKPLDVRLVVNKYEDLTNGTIRAPYQGMVVNVAGTRDLYILKEAGIEASTKKENWFKVSDVEVISRTEFENPQTYFENLFHDNPQEGLIISISGSADSYVLIDPENYKNPESWLRIGGIAEEYSMPVLVDYLIDPAHENVHNTFNKNEDFYILLDHYKSPDSFISRHYEMVTLEMLDNLLDEVYERIEEIRQSIYNRIDIVENLLNNRINEVENNLNKNITDIDLFHTNENERLDKNIEDNVKYLKNKIDINDNNINSRINDEIDKVNNNINDIDKYYSHEVNILDEKINSVNSNLRDKIDNAEHVLTENINNTKNEFNNKLTDIDIYQNSENERLEEKINNVNINLKSDIINSENSIYKKINEINNNLIHNIEDVDNYYENESNRLDNKIEGVQTYVDISIDIINDKIKKVINNNGENLNNVVTDLTNYVDRLERLIFHGNIDEGVEDGKHDTNINNTLKSIHYISDWLKKHKEDFEDLKKIHKDDFNNLNIKIEELEKRINDEINNKIEELDDKIEKLDDKIEDIRDLLMIYVRPQLHLEPNDKGTIDMIYDKSIRRGDTIEFNEYEHKLIFTEADPNNWTEKRLIIKDNKIIIEERKSED